MKIIGVKQYKELPVQVRASLWFLICSFLQKGISVITTPIFTRILSTSDYGHISVWSSWSGIVGIIITLQLSAGVYTQGLIKFRGKEDIFSSALQGLNFMLCLFWTVIYIAAREFWNQLFGFNTVQMLAMLFSIWVGAAFTFWTTAQRVQYKYRAMVAITLASSVLCPIFQIFLVFRMDDKVTAKILGGLIVNLILYSWTFFYQVNKGKTFYSKKIWRYALLYNIPLIPHYLSGVVLNSSDRIMIESMVGFDAAGIYSLAYNLALIMTLFNDSICKTMNPWIYAKIRDQRTDDIHKIVYPAMIFIAGMNIILIAFAPEAVKIFAPPAYYEAIYVIPPVAMSVFFMFVYNVFVPFEFYYEKQRYIAISSVGAAVANIILNYIFIGIFGYIAAGYTTLVCYVIYAFLHYHFMRVICKDKLENPRVYKPKYIMMISFAFMAVGFLFLSVYNLPIIRYSLIVIMGIVVIGYRRKIMAYVNSFMNLKKDKTV